VICRSPCPALDDATRRSDILQLIERADRALKKVAWEFEK
jgi:hypothetical protein